MSQTPRGRRWTGWSTRQPSLLRPFPVLRFEQLESRLAPATFVWSGASGIDNNWGTPTNWVGNVAPTGNPAAGDDLVFTVAAPPALRATNNNLTNGVFDSISFGAGGYTLTGNAITLTGGGASAAVVVNSGSAGNTIAMDTALGAAAGIVQTISVASGADLTLSGHLGGTTGSTLTKDGPGTLVFTNDNSGFTGAINLKDSGGALVITNAHALGDSVAPTTVGTNASLRVQNVTGPITEPLILNGPGTANDGALLNLSGTNTWAGPITLDSDATIGSAAGTLDITGQVTDTGAGHNLTKEGVGEVVLDSPTGNTYRGQTVINDGTLTVTTPTALGPGGSPSNGTVVNQTLTKSGQLQIREPDPNAFGFTIADENLILNGAGSHNQGHPGALTNTQGTNAWGGPVILGSPTPDGSDVTVGAVAGTTLIVSGVVSSPNGAFAFNKTDAGRLVLNNANTYTGVTNVLQGTLDVRDSNALGSTAAGTNVSNGATLALEVEAALPVDPVTNPRYDVHGRDLWDDSVTHDPNRLSISEPLTIAGRGVNNTGALDSISGINVYNVPIRISIDTVNLAAAVGVEADQRPGHPTPNANYFIDDYSLTAAGGVVDAPASPAADPGADPDTNEFVKRGGGDLILPVADTYTGITRVEQGWVTVQNNRSLGADRTPAVAAPAEPRTVVSAGAAVHVRPLVPGTSLTIPENITLAGVGPTLPYALISQKGALMNLDGNNTWSGDIGFIGQAGVGVEQVVPGSPSTSELSVTGSTTQGTNSFTFGASGGPAEQSFKIDTGGATSGTLRVSYDFFTIPDELRVYYPPRGPGQVRIYDTGLVNGARVITIPFGPGTGTTLELVMDEGGGLAGTAWVLHDVSLTTDGGLIKLGSQRLNLLGDGTYGGATEVREGTLRARNDTALGHQSSGTATTQQTYTPTTTAVASGAVLELAQGAAPQNGGVASGIQIWDEHLVLNSPGQQVAVAGDLTPAPTAFTLTFGGQTTAPIPVGASAGEVAAALIALSSIGGAGGVVTVAEVPAAGGTTYAVTFGGTLANTDVAQMTAAAVGGGTPPTVTTQQNGGAGASEVQTVQVVASNTTFTLAYKGQTTAPLPITATAAQVQAALNALSGVTADVGAVTVTRTGNVFTVVFGTALTPDVPFLVATPLGGAEVTVSGGNAPLDNLNGDNAWRGPVTLNAGTRVASAANSRLSLLGAIDDDPNPAAGGSDFVKRGIGDLILAGNNTYRGTTLIDQGVVTAMSSTAFGTTASGTTVSAGAQLQLQGSLTVAGEPLTIQGAGLANSQTLAVSGTAGTYTLTFSGQTTPAQAFNATAADIQTALDNLSTIGGVGGSVAVTTDPNAGFVITFLGSLANATVPLIAAAGTGGTVVTTGVLTPPNFPARWFSVGPAPSNNGQAAKQLPTSGRITSVAADPTDPDVIYVATAGGGAWKSKDGGHTWLPLFDATVDPAAVMYGGAIALDPSDPNTVYFGTGESNGFPNGAPIPGQQDNFAGSGIYKSTDSGTTWTLLTNADGSNPLAGQAVSKLIVDPIHPGLIYVATGTSNVLDASPSAVPGVWRFEAGGWVNMTGVVSLNRQTVVGQTPFDKSPPQTPGPDDDYRLVFPQSNATWTDLFLAAYPSGDEVLYAALGESNQQYFTGAGGVFNAVYRTFDPTDPNPAWIVGTTPAAGAKPDGRTTGFPVGPITPPTGTPPNPPAQIPQAGTNGNIKISGVITDPINEVATIYAAVVQPDWSYLRGELQSVQKSITSGSTWTTVSNVPAGSLGTATFNPGSAITREFNILPALGRYDLAVLVDPNDTTGNTVYLAGFTNIYQNTTGGTQPWATLTPDTSGAAPAAQFHSLFLDSGRRLLSGSDGGVWRWDPTLAVPGQVAFSDLNGNLAVTQLNSADPYPTDLGRAYAGAEDNGTQQFSDSQAWQRVDDTTGSVTGVVRYDPKNPLTAYAVRDGVLRKTTNGGASWTTLRQVSTSPPIIDPLDAYNQFPLVVDPVNTSRILIGGPSFDATLDITHTGLAQSTDGGQSFTDLQAKDATNHFIAVTAIGAATFQGQFATDPGFPTVTDKLSNTYDPNTIYVTNGTELLVTKNDGVSWQTRTPAAAAGGTITDIAVDPSNRDTVYVTVSRVAGLAGGRLFRSTDAGRSWTDISGNLPLIPTWKVAIDPRSNTAYVGNDDGVWQLPAAATATTFSWSRFGAGMPAVRVTDLVVNQTLNTLTAATYGRGMYQLFLPDYQPNSGGVRAVSGSSVWTGPVTLAGDTALGAAGTQNIQNGIAAASLNFIGTVADDTPGANHTLTKVGQGTIVLSGANTYGGQTVVQQGVLQVNNPQALGAATPTGNTVVTAGAALELRSDLQLEPVTVFGNGIPFNGHYTGALRNVANNNTYTGPLTLGTNTTIGVDSGSSLTIGSKPGVLAGTGSITDNGNNFSFDKELTGTLVLAAADTYGGTTRVVQGALQVQDPNALGGTAGGTVVLDGAQLQLARNAVTHAPTVVTGEPLTLSGTGIFGTGALLNAPAVGDADPTGANDNTWAGPVTFDIAPNFFPATNPGTQVAVGVSDPADTLTVNGVIGQDSTQASFGLLKVGPGRLTLSQANTFTGVTDIVTGAVRIQNNAALGPPVSSQVETISVVGTTNPNTGLPYTYGLTFNGQTVNGIASTASATTVQTALESLSTIGTGNVLVTETPNATGKVLTVTFRGALANTPQSLITATPQAGLAVATAVAQAGGLGTVVHPGGSLELDGDPTGVGANMSVAELLTIAGDGLAPGNAGALNNVSGNNTYTAPVVLGGAATIGAGAGTTLTTAAGVQDPALVNAARLRKAGAGTVVFPIANPYAGKTVVDQGVLRILDPHALGVVRSEIQNVQVLATTGSFALTFAGQTTAAVPFNATAAQVQAALNALPAIGKPEIQTVQVTGATTGSYTLTFNGQTTATPLPYNATAAQVQAALNALPTIGGVGGTVAVTGTPVSGGGTRFTVTFGGTLAAADQPQITAAPAGGTIVTTGTTQNGGGATVTRAAVAGGFVYQVTFVNALANANLPPLVATVAAPGPVLTVTTVQDGSEGTTVTSGATLQVAGGITMTDEAVTIAGPGFNSQGALNDAGGAVTWAVPLTLGGNASVGTTAAGDRLTFTAPITDNGNAYNLDVVGPGTVIYTAPVDNQYTGTTTVRQGTLLLSQATGRAILGPLVVGGGAVPALARETDNDQIADTAPVTVNANGTFDLNSLADTIGTLTVNAGTVTTGAGGRLTTADVNMTGGSVTVGDNGSLTSADVTMNGGTLAVGGTKAVAAVGNVAMSNGAALSVGANGILTAGAVTETGSTITLAAGVTATTGDVSMTGGSVAAGDNDKLTTGNVTMSGGTFTAGGTGVTVAAGNLTLSNAAAFSVGTNSTLTAGAVTGTGASTVALGAGDTATTKDVSLTGGSFTAGDGDTLTTGNVTLSNAAFAAGVGGTVTTGTVTGTGASTVAFGAGTTAGTGDVSLTGGSFTAGDGATVTTGNITLAGAAAFSVGAGDSLTAGTVTGTGASTVALGAGTTATTKDISLTGGSFTAGDADTLTAGNVTVSGGTFALGGTAASGSVGTVTLTNSTFSVGANGTLTAGAVTETGSTLTVGTGAAASIGAVNLTASGVSIAASGIVTLGGDVTVAAAATPSTVTGPGTLDLGGADRTVTVADGAPAEDFQVSAQLVDASGEHLIKAGPGRLALSATVSHVPVDVQAGDVQVGTGAGVGPVDLAGGSLSGTGTVDSIAGATAGTPAVGTVSPGIGAAANPAGILHSNGPVTWGSGTTYAVDLASGTPGAPAAGTDYDQLAVTGAIDLGGATLTGTFGSGIQFGDRFTIITATGGVTGRFAGPGTLFIQGEKFQIDYSDPTKVVLQKIRADVTAAVATSVNPSTLHQPVLFTVTLTPEAGAGAIPTTSTVTFTIDGGAVYPPVTVNVDATGRHATLDTSTLPGGFLAGGSHTVTVRFNGDPLNFNPATAALASPQVVEVPVIDPLTVAPIYTSPNNSPGIQDSVAVSTTVREERSATTWTVTVTNGAGVVVRTYTGAGVITGNTFPVAVTWDGKDGSGAFVPDGTYTVTASFLDVWGNTAATPAVAVVVDNTSPVVTPAPTATRVIAPGTAAAVPTTVTFDAVAADSGSGLAGWKAIVADATGKVVRTYTGTIAGATAVLGVTWDGTDGTGAIVPDGLYTVTFTARDLAGNTSAPATSQIAVLTHPPAVTLTSGTPTVYGQAITFTATVSEPIPQVADLLVGTSVQFFNGATLLGTGTIALTGGQYQATLTVPTFNAGTYTDLTAVYPGTTNFLPAASPTYTHVVLPARLTVTADNQTKVYGAPLPALTYAVAGLVNGDTQGGVLAGGLGTTATAASSVGTYAITQGSLALTTGNYTLTFNPGTLTITPAPLTVRVDDQTKVYGSPLPPLTVTAIGLVNGDTPAGVLTGSPTTAATAGSPVGTYAIAPGTLAANKNYQATFVPGTLTVTPAPLTIAVNDQTKVYGAAVPALTVTVTGLVNGDTQTGVVFGAPVTAVTAASPVGTYAIAPGTLAANKNYQVTVTPGTLTVTPAPLTITVNDATRLFHTPNPAFTATYQGLVNGDTAAVVTGLTLITTATIASVVGTYPITAAGTPTAANYAVTVVPGTLTITHARPESIVDIPPAVAIGSGAGTAPQVSEYAAAQGGLLSPVVSRFYPQDSLPAGFTGGVRVAAADFNGDGESDIVLGTGPGTVAQVTVLDGKTRQPIFTLNPFESFTGGVFVTTGDVTGDGIPDLVITPDEGGGPRVLVFDGNGFTKIADFYGIADPNFRGGARAAVADLNHDGFGDLAVAAGFGGGPRVSVWDGQSIVAGQPTNLFNDFYIFGGSDAQTLRNGVFIAAGDVNGDGYADLIAGGGPGGGPRVTVVDGKSLLAGQGPTPIANFYAGDPNNRGGVRVAVKSINGDNKADLVVGAGDGDGSRVTGYLATDILSSTQPPSAFAFDAFDNVTNGVYVG